MFSTKILLAASLLTVCVPAVSADLLDLDFDNEMGEWRVVVDGVMGGRSTGHVARNEPGVLQFSGDLSLANNGGFSQMRCDVSGDQFAGMRGIEITVRGDGRDYNFDIRCANARVMAGGFQRAFGTKDGEWTTVRLPFDEFRLYSFGRLVPGAPSIVPTMIESLGVTLSDKKEGPFRLDVASIRAFGDEADLGEATRSDLASLSRQSTLEKLRGLIETDPGEATRLDHASLSRRSTLEKLRGLIEADDRAPAAAETTASAEAARLIELAINRGVPLFNEGQPAACAAIYEVTIEAMVGLGAGSLEHPVVEGLQKSLAQAKTDRTPSERAWTYRRALDDVYGHIAREVDRGRRVAAH